MTFLSMSFGSGNMLGRCYHFFCCYGSMMAFAVTSFVDLAFIADRSEEPASKNHDPHDQQVIEFLPGFRPEYVMFVRNFYLMSHCFIVIRCRLSLFFSSVKSLL